MYVSKSNLELVKTPLTMFFLTIYIILLNKLIILEIIKFL